MTENDEADFELIHDDNGNGMFLPADLKLVTCSLCHRYAVTRVAVHQRETVHYYLHHRLLVEKSALPLPNGRPQCRDCLSYSSRRSSHNTTGIMDRAQIADARMKN